MPKKKSKRTIGKKYTVVPPELNKKNKYTKEVVDCICEELETLRGRVSACEKAGICYETFLHWLDTKPEFVKRIQKAESKGDNFGEEYAIKAVFAAMPKAWQSAAWWLERTKKRKYSQYSEVNNPSENQKSIDSKETAFDVKEALVKKPILPDADGGDE